MAEKNKIYYGEYTLKHWIDLILIGNIILPDYQRFFVWDKENSKSLVEALFENQFVPPITIGRYIDGGETQNIILDGQQRLTSILLSYLNLFPPKYQDGSINPNFINDNDDDDDDENVFINWDFKRLLKLINSSSLRDQTKIHNEAKTVGYEDMYDGDMSTDISRFGECYLGFSFIVPESTNSKAQQKYYSKAFRSINLEGKKLLPLESREALYYLNKDLVDLFSPDFAEIISVNEGKLDFVRFLSMLSQYSNGGKDKIARGYSKNMETYYENFIYSVVDDKKTKEFVKLSDIIPNLNYKKRMEKLRLVIDEMNLKTKYESIIDLDLYLFGIIYLTIFEGKQIDSDRYEELKVDIKNEIDDIKRVPLHIKNPSALKHLKQRIDKSINICEAYTL